MVDTDQPDDVVDMRDSVAEGSLSILGEKMIIQAYLYHASPGG